MMKATGEQLISGIFIVAGMVYMQVHSIALWETMFEEGGSWKAYVPSIMLESMALWAWYKAKFTKETWHKALGFLLVAIASSIVVVVTTTMNVSFDVTVDQEEVKQADNIIKRNIATLEAQQIALKKASFYGLHPAVLDAQKEIKKAEGKIAKAESLKDSKDTDKRLEMKSWIMAVTNTIILIMQIISAHTIREKDPIQKKKTKTNPEQGGNNEEVVIEQVIAVPEQKMEQQQNTPEQLKARELLDRLEALSSKFNGESVGTILSTRVEHYQDGERKFWNRNIKNKLDSVIESGKGLAMEKMKNLEVGIERLEGEINA
jgi:hypothetical protein